MPPSSVLVADRPPAAITTTDSTFSNLIAIEDEEGEELETKLLHKMT